MKKIGGFNGKALKVSGNGYILYELWVNVNGDFFVKFIENEVNTDQPGTLSKNIFYSIKKYADIRDSKDCIGKPVGIDERGMPVTPSSNNNGAFLKAVLDDFLHMP